MSEYQDKTVNRIIREMTAMDDNEKWHDLSKEELTPILNKLDLAKCEPFAEYLNNRFMDAARACDMAKVNAQWATTSDADKIAFAQKIVNTLIDMIYQDIQNDYVTIYNNDGSVHKTPTDHPDYYKQDLLDYIKNKVKITVQKSDQGLMGTNRTYRLNINPGWPLYNSLRFFLADLRHEMSHVVDMYISDISPIDPQVRRTAYRYYIGGQADFETYYKQNPAELNANLKRAEFLKTCRSQLETTPDLSMMAVAKQQDL